MIPFFEKIEDIKCLQGDTLPVFCVQTDIPYSDMANYSMVLIVESNNLNDAGTSFQKNCEASIDEEEKTKFSVQLTSEDTKLLSGFYILHFRMTDENNLEYAKIACNLIVKKIAQKGESA
jgi:hypothetical protein